MSVYSCRQSIWMVLHKRVHSRFWMLLGLLTQLQFQQVASVSQIHFSSKHASHPSAKLMHTGKTETPAAESMNPPMESEQNIPDSLPAQVSKIGDKGLMRSAKVRRHPEDPTSPSVSQRRRALGSFCGTINHTISRHTKSIPNGNQWQRRNANLCSQQPRAKFG